MTGGHRVVLHSPDTSVTEILFAKRPRIVKNLQKRTSRSFVGASSPAAEHAASSKAKDSPRWEHWGFSAPPRATIGVRLSKPRNVFFCKFLTTRMSFGERKHSGGATRGISSLSHPRSRDSLPAPGTGRSWRAAYGSGLPLPLGHVL